MKCLSFTFPFFFTLFLNSVHGAVSPAWSVVPNITWTWGYFDYTRAQKTRYACSSSPTIPYCLSISTDKDCAMVNGLSCPSPEICMANCVKSCLPFKDVYQQTDPANQPYTGWPGVTFKKAGLTPERGECFPVIDSREGSATPLQMYFIVPEISLNSTGPTAVITPSPPNSRASLDYSTTSFRLEITSRYGDWLFDGCSTTTSDGKTSYSCANSQTRARIEIFKSTGAQPVFSTITISGTYQQVLDAVQIVKYQPHQYVNSLRLKAKHLSPISCKYQPFETLIFNLTIGECSSGGCSIMNPASATVLPNWQVLVNIIDNNDMPGISDPQLCYFRPGCKGDIRSIVIQSGGSGYEDGAPVTAYCNNSDDCKLCVTRTFQGTLIVDAGKVTAINITNAGEGYRSRYSPILLIDQTGKKRTGSGAVLLAEVADDQCPYPQTSEGVPWENKVSPDEVQAYRGCAPEPDCSAGNAFTFTKSLKTYSYFFGQFWRYEDQGENLMIEDIAFSDVDATESCPYFNPFCTELDFLVRAQLGAPMLNRITDIKLYLTLRSEYNWNSNIWQANNALKMLRYAIEKPEFLGPTSAVADYNSQAVGKRPEFIVVGVNDQGFTGATGLSRCFKGEEFRGMGDGPMLSCGLRINVTIVAVNDAPVITTPDKSYFTPRENIPYRLEQLGVVDSDVGEVTTSSMALHDWAASPDNADYMNKIKVRLTVQKGNLLLSPAARDLTATMNASQLWLTLSRYRAGHDTCRVLPCLRDPASCANGRPVPGRVLYQDVCSFRENTPATARLAKSSCEGPTCTCLLLDDCRTTGEVLAFLNASKERRGELGGKLDFIALLYEVLPLFDATCGGLPFFPSPNPFSWGRRCAGPMDCQPPRAAPACVPGDTCRCCADLRRVCASAADCGAYAPYDACGCVAGLDPPCTSCFCCNNMSVACSADADCGPKAVGPLLGNRSRCGCDPARHSICGPFGQALPDGDAADRLGTGRLLTGGTPCQYRGADAGTCLPGAKLWLGTQKADIVSLMQTDGSARLELFGPAAQVNAALARMRYNTSQPAYLFYSKRYRPPVEQRSADFDLQRDDDDSLALYVHDMGNTGGTARRCALCRKHAACNADCSQCVDVPRAYAGCWAEKRFTVAVSSTNCAPEVLAPQYVGLIEGQPLSLLSTDRVYIRDGILALAPGPPFVPVYSPPPAAVLSVHRTCNDTDGTVCVPAWGPTLTATLEQQLANFPEKIYQAAAQGISIVDPDWQDFGYDDLFIAVNLSCSHGRLFLNETFLQEIHFDGNLACDLTNPDGLPPGCRLRLKDYGHPQGKVGLYARIEAPTPALLLAPFCPSVVDVAPGKRAYQPPILSPPAVPRPLPLVEESAATSSMGCPCYSTLNFDEVGQGLDAGMEHCSAPIDSDGTPIGSVGLVGNRFIAIEGRLRDVIMALSNVTYLPDPYFNTDLPGTQEKIIVTVDDQGALGDVIKDAVLGLVPSPHLRDTAEIRVNVTAVNDPPVIGRRVALKCDPALEGRKMACPLGPNDPVPVRCDLAGKCAAKDLRQLRSWTQVPGWPSRSAKPALRFRVVSLNSSLDGIDVDEDTRFALTPDVLWVHDPDSEEAATIYDARCLTSPQGRVPPVECLAPACAILCRPPYGQNLQDRFLCGADTGRPFEPCNSIADTMSCRCGAGDLGCTNPRAASAQCTYVPGAITRTSSGPGQLMLELRVTNGRLTFYPQPPQFPATLRPDFTLLARGDEDCLASAGCKNFVPCRNEAACYAGVRVVTLIASLDRIQFALTNRYISYLPDPNFYGTDTLEVWVSDQGYTSENYATARSASVRLAITVVGINDSPAVSYPSNVLLFQKGIVCRTDYQEYDLLEGTYCGLLTGSTFDRNTTALPPTGPMISAADSQGVGFADVDVEDSFAGCIGGCGNLTVSFRFDRRSTASIYFAETRSLLRYSEYLDASRLTTTAVSGKLVELNLAMRAIFFDPDDAYLGYAPITILVVDNGGYGECAADAQCGTFDAVTRAQLLPCVRRDRMPCARAMAGTRTVSVDAVIGALQRCKYSDCLNCNRDKTCGWCPTTCGGAGKCMIGFGRPTFDICPGGLAFNGTPFQTYFAPGEGYGTCRGATMDLPLIIGTVLAAAVVLGVVGRHVRRRIAARHGSVARYAAKKRFDLLYHGRRLNLIAPVGASYDKLAVLVALAVIAAVFAINIIAAADGPYVLKQAFFLDTAASVRLRLDNCKMRFLPSWHPSAAPGDRELNAIKVRFWYPTDPAISLAADVCSRYATFEVQNNRPIDSKYNSYWCSVDVLVPDLTILPSVHIEALGENETSVRGGPMDRDTPNFGLDFGPNTLSIRGALVRVRLHNVTAKRLVMDIVHGGITAVDLGNRLGRVSSASIATVDADIAITTLRPTTARVRQNSADLTCISAPPGSLYRDTPCQRVCGFVKPPPPPPPPPPGAVVTEDDFEPCLGKVPRPLVTGCYDPDTCAVVATQECFCKPTCEAPYSPVNGVCQEDGTCCRTECGGFSLFDLFPVPNTTRCGVCVDPLTMPWNNGMLEQQWTVTSLYGMISLQVGQSDSEAEPRLYSYKGRPLADTAPEVDIDVDARAKPVLDSAFHAGGGPAPKEDWFWLRVTGTGVPEDTDGSFLWVVNIRYLVVPTWFIRVFSLELLAPTKSSAAVAINPGFCPGYVPKTSAEANVRLVRLYTTLLSTLETYPPDQVRRPLQYLSVLGWLPAGDAPNTFRFDSAVNKYKLEQVDPADFAPIITMQQVSIAAPAAVAFVVLAMISGTYAAVVREYRKRTVNDEETLARLGSIMHVDESDEDNADADPCDPTHHRELMDKLWDKVPEEKKAEMRSRTTVFYMMDLWVMGGPVVRSQPERLRDAVRDAVLIGAPVAYTLYMAACIQTATLDDLCYFRVDKSVCYSEPVFLVSIMRYLCAAYTAVCFAEATCHYLLSKWGPLRKAVRYSFYVVFFLFHWAGCFQVLLCCTWVLIGVVVLPYKMLPYAVCLLCFVVGGASAYAKERRIQQQVLRGVRARVREYIRAAQLLRVVPQAILSTLVNSKIMELMHANGLSNAKLLWFTAVKSVGLALAFTFVLMGVQAFMDTNSRAEATLNMSLIVSVTAIFIWLAGDDGDRGMTRTVVDGLQNCIVSATEQMLGQVRRQIETMQRVRAGVRAAMAADRRRAELERRRAREGATLGDEEEVDQGDGEGDGEDDADDGPTVFEWPLESDEEEENERGPLLLGR